ncbi:hypothetical protein TUN205_00111 [Pyrenophora tritici-repentis]|nr:hypothetical protein Alg215_03018 [Pyrenophora tritici-repentis]KAI0615736.1 hypothetical protein TUN205_00111 [Pyrenophora tritici-repentis]
MPLSKAVVLAARSVPASDQKYCNCACAGF